MGRFCPIPFSTKGRCDLTIQDAHLQFSGALSKRARTTDLVLHHAEAEKATVEDIHRWHLDNGWIGIGYHYYVRKDGSVWRGRPEDTIGCLVYTSRCV